MAEEKNFANILKTAFDRTLMDKFGTCVPPEPYVTPFGIKHLDALLGGGLTSSSPIAFSSTPETGKSTCALQFCSMFQSKHPDSVVVYLDTESAAGGESTDIEDRINTFDIDRERFLYKAIVMDVKQTFEMLEELVKLKTQLQEKTGKEYFVLFVLDSIAATGSSKDASAEDPNSIIGYKARELSFILTKYKQHISMQRVSFIIIDQVRANLDIRTPWQKVSDEKSVGTFGNFKSATNVNSLQHNIRQWLWLSKGVQLKPQDPMGVDGWVLNVYMEKNKLAPSGYSVPLVFDKKYGIIPILSEYYFLSNQTKTEKKYWPKKEKMPYPLLINGATNKRTLEVVDPNTGEVLYSSSTFNERNFIEKYRTDNTFRQWFDYAAQVSAEQRIKINLFRNEPTAPEQVDDRPQGNSMLGEMIDEHVDDADVETESNPLGEPNPYTEPEENEDDIDNYNPEDENISDEEVESGY